MIFLTGHRATGKSTVGKLLENQNYWFLDAGPLWRQLRDDYDPNLSAEEYVVQMTAESNNPNWTNDFLAGRIVQQYQTCFKEKVDLALGGYRSFEEITYISSLLTGNIYPKQDLSIFYISCPFEVALDRYRKREGITDGEAQLRAYYQHELELGLGETQRNANRHIHNNSGLEELQAEINGTLGLDQPPYSGLKEAR